MESLPSGNQVPSKNYIHYQLPKGDLDNYLISAKIGRGRYSEVFEGMDTKNQTKIVAKILKPIDKIKIKREVYILNLLKNAPYTVQLLSVAKAELSQIYTLVYKSIEGQDLKKYSKKLGLNDIKIYMKKILEALAFYHKKKIIHRDIKLGNIVVNNETKELEIIDFGLAEFYVENYKYECRVGSRCYKCPELLLNFKKYDTSIDIWSAGCILGALIFKLDFLFNGSDNKDQLVKIVETLGYKTLENFLDKYKGLVYLEESQKNLMKNFNKKEWKEFINNENKDLCDSVAIDLLDKMLQFDKDCRITAEEALKHPFFKDINI